MNYVAKPVSPHVAPDYLILESTHADAFGNYLRFSDMLRLTGLKKSSAWAMQNPSAPQFDPDFPRSYQLTARTKVWKKVEVLAWIESKAIEHHRRYSTSPAARKGLASCKQ